MESSKRWRWYIYAPFLSFFFFHPPAPTPADTTEPVPIPTALYAIKPPRQQVLEAAVTAVKVEKVPIVTPTKMVPARPHTTPHTNRPEIPGSSITLSGSHEDWMRAAGIPQTDWQYVEFIIAHESGWNPNAVNKSSGACGLGQQLPCGKWPHRWNDPVGSLIDASAYAKARYGSWAAAYSHWLIAHWW